MRLHASLRAGLRFVFLCLLEYTLVLRGEPWAAWCAVVALLAAGAAAWWLLRTQPRLGALAAGLAGGAVALGLSLWIHEDLRGEHPDPGPEPARVKPWAKPGDNLGLPASVPGRPRLVVWGDCRNSTEVQDRLVAEIRRRRPDLSVGLGDFVGMARTYQFELLARRLAPTNVVTFLVPGNHDLDPFGTLKPYARVLGAPNWSCVLDKVLLLGLNTAHGAADPQDVAWLEAEVARFAPHVKRTLLFCHHPVFAPLNHPKKALPDDEATARLRALVEREGMAVFSGNFHGYDVQRHGRALQVVTGGAGSRPESDAPYHCVAVEIDEEVRVEQVVLAQQHEISETRERFRVLRDEGAYAAGTFPLRVFLAIVGFAMFLGGLVLAAWRRRSPHSSSASSV